MFSMTKDKDDNWTYIRVRISTVKKLKQIKLDKDMEMYDDVLVDLLSKEKLK